MILIGLESVGLKTFIENHSECIGLIFPTQEEAVILGSDLKSRLQFLEERLETNSDVMNILLHRKRKEGGVRQFSYICTNLVLC